jgi:hypothetical protein
MGWQRRYGVGIHQVLRPKRPEDFSLTVQVLVWWHSVEVGDGEEGDTSGSGPEGQERQDPADPAQRNE